MRSLKVTTAAVLFLFAFSGCKLPGSFPKNSVFEGPYFPAATTPTIALPTGEWHLIASGRIYDFTISTDSSGAIAIRSSLGRISDIHWNSSTGKLSFKRFVELDRNSYPCDLDQHYTGYLMAYDIDDFKWRLAGTFTQKCPIIVRPNAAWYATKPRDLSSPHNPHN